MTFVSTNFFNLQYKLLNIQNDEYNGKRFTKRQNVTLQTDGSVQTSPPCQNKKDYFNELSSVIRISANSACLLPTEPCDSSLADPIPQYISVTSVQTDVQKRRPIFNDGTDIACSSHNLHAILSNSNNHQENVIKWNIKRPNIELEYVLGEGEFGIVYRAQLKLRNKKIPPVDNNTYQLVAVKMSKGSNNRMALLQEANLMKTLLGHPNVIQIFGICCTEESDLLIMEYAENGDLLSILRQIHKSLHLYDEYKDTCCYCESITNEVKQNLIPWLLETIKQVAKGMHFLSCKNVIHRDLASRNILISKNGVAKIGDFGLGKCVNDNYEYVKKSQQVIPFQSMAPETLAAKIYSSKSDVWAFGILSWEVFSLGLIPYSSLEIKNLSTIFREYENPRPSLASDSVFALMGSCWKKNPDDRPDFSKIVQLLTLINISNSFSMCISALSHAT